MKNQIINSLKQGLLHAAADHLSNIRIMPRHVVRAIVDGNETLAIDRLESIKNSGDKLLAILEVASSSVPQFTLATHQSSKKYGPVMEIHRFHTYKEAHAHAVAAEFDTAFPQSPHKDELIALLMADNYDIEAIKAFMENAYDQYPDSGERLEWTITHFALV